MILKNKNIIFLFMIFFIFFTSTYFVSGFAMSPPSNLRDNAQYDIGKGLSQTVTMTLISRSSQNIVLDVKQENFALDKYVSYDVELINLKPGERKTFTFTINIPPGLDLVDKQEARIVFHKRVEGNDGFLVITTALGYRFVVDFSYPGKYLQITGLDVKNVNQGEDSSLSWSVVSRGFDPTSFNVEFSLFNDERVFSSKTYGPYLLTRGESKSGTDALLTSTLTPGTYNVSLRMAYDGPESIKYGLVRVGQEDVFLKNFSPVNMTPNALNKFVIEIENLWNAEFNNVYAEVKINNSVAVTRTVKLPAFGVVSVDQFIDTTMIGEGPNKAYVKIFFGNNVKEYVVDVNFVSDKKESSGAGILTITLVSLLIILIVLGLLFFLKKRKLDEEKSKISKGKK